MINLISWLGTVTSILGSFAIAFGFVFLGYCFFIVGSASWLIVATKRKDKSLFVLNAVFFVANIIGFVRNF